MTWKKKEAQPTRDLPKLKLKPFKLPGIESCFMLVTPEIAREWLTHNVKNRTLSEDSANALARDIKSGNWLTTHQGIAFNDRNELMDGQHRLEAIIRANKAAILMVTIG